MLIALVKNLIENNLINSIINETSNILLKQNNALANATAGFVFTTVNPALISECKASANSTGFDLSATNTCVIEKCTASANSGIGFNGNGTTNEIFLLNNAMQNGTNYLPIIKHNSLNWPKNMKLL